MEESRHFSSEIGQHFLQTNCRWYNWMNTQELRRSCAGKIDERQKSKTHNFVSAFGTYQWRKMSAPSTSSLGPWIYLWSYSATLTIGFKSSVIAVLFSVTLCLGTVSTGWKRLQLESWQTCSVMRKSFWELWKSRGNWTSWHMLCLLLFQSVQLLNLRYLEKLLRLLDVKDSPTLSLVFRCKLALALHFLS